MKIYLAGPMRGFPLRNQGPFSRSAESLRALGHEVWSPHEDDLPPGLPLRDYLKIDLPALLSSEAIAMLPGWRGSDGARLEHAVAKACSMPILSASGDPLHETILDEAQEIVYGPRQEAYGHPREDFERTAGMLRSLFGWEVEAKDIPDLMICVKLSRRRQSSHQRDHLVDIAGYAGCAEVFLEA